jgi:hypothetical protein
VGILGACAVYLAFFDNGTSLFSPAPVAPRTQWQPVAPQYMPMPQQPAMMWQPNSAQPMAYASAQQGYATTQTNDEFSQEAWIASCFAFGAAAGYGAYAVLAVGGEEPTEKEKTLGAAGLGGVLGVVLFGSLPGAVLAAGAAAYACTKSDAVKSAGEATAKVYTKAVELEQEYEVLPKAKSAVDTVVTVADNLNKNYGLTDKLDEKLQLSARAESLTEKFNSQKDKVTGKFDELKDKASS